MEVPASLHECLLGVGCDTEVGTRLGRVLTRNQGFMKRWYTDAERARIAHSDNPLDLALCLFCLKEAAIKALGGTMVLGPSRIEALPVETGFQVCVTNPPTASIRLEGRAESGQGIVWAEVLAWSVRETV